MAGIRQLFSMYFPPTLIFYQLLRSPPHPPICQTMRGIATTRPQCVHKTHIGTLGISVVNQSAKIPFGRRLLLPSGFRACCCGWHWRADRAMESCTGHTAVRFHFKDLPLPLPQCVLRGHFSRFLPQSPQTSRLRVHVAFPAAHMPSVFLFTFKIAAVTSMPTGTMESTISSLCFVLQWSFSLFTLPSLKSYVYPVTQFAVTQSVSLFTSLCCFIFVSFQHLISSCSADTLTFCFVSVLLAFGRDGKLCHCAPQCSTRNLLINFMFNICSLAEYLAKSFF